jgi:hypothetical protein
MILGQVGCDLILEVFFNLFYLINEDKWMGEYSIYYSEIISSYI